MSSTTQNTEKQRAISAPYQSDWATLLSEWKVMFNPQTIPKDIWSGITVALVALPLNLALAIAAGVEPGVGITTGIIAGFIGGLFGGQKYAITGPAAAMAVVLIELARNYGIGSIWLVGLCAAIMQLIAGFFKLGRFISFLPMPVIVGFANAIGVLVFFNAIDDFLGLPTKIAHAGHDPLINLQFIPEFFVDLISIWKRCLIHQEMNFYAILIGSISLIIAFFTPKVTKAVPGQLVSVVTATILTNTLSIKIPVIKDIASVPNNLPLPSIPNIPWNDFGILFPTAITVFTLGSIESLLSASVADGMTGSSKHRSNQELIGQGLANLVVPFFGGIPVTGVIARTAVNIRSGARTRLSALVHCITLTILIFFLAKYAEQIPLAALASILMLTGYRLIEWEAMHKMWQVSRKESYVAIATTIASVAIDLTAGVFTGLAFACALFIKQISQVNVVAYGEQADDNLITDLPSCKHVRTYLVDGPLFFGAAERFIENILIVDDVRIIILHMKAARLLDLTGVETLLSIHAQLKKQNSKLFIAELPQQAFQLLEKTGALQTIGTENVFSNYQTALATANLELLNSLCQDCRDKGKIGSTSTAPKDCRLNIELQNKSSSISKLLDSLQNAGSLVKTSGLEWLLPINSADEIPAKLKNTPFEILIKGQNFGLVTEREKLINSLIIGMCIDVRKTLNIPKDWAHMMRREGANMQGTEFAIALALVKGVRHMALIVHNNCAMVNTSEQKEDFLAVLTNEFSWEKEKAIELFNEHARSREIGNEIDFAVEEAKRLEGLFPGLTVVPFLFRAEDTKLYFIYDWFVENSNDKNLLDKLQLKDTGQFVKPKSDQDSPTSP